MTSEENTDVPEVDAIELNASEAGVADETNVTDQLDDGEEEVDENDDDDDDEMTSFNRTHDTSMATDEDETTIKSNNDASSQDEEEEDGDEDQDEEDEGTTQNNGLNVPKEKPTKAGHAKSSGKKGRVPSVVGLTIPFRTVKKAMKLDPDTPIVQNEAAVMLTYASELFLKKLAKRSFRNAKNRGRSTIRYEDIAEARTNDPALSFLEMLLP